MKSRFIVSIAIALTMVLILPAAIIQAVPAKPHAFYGSVIIGGIPATEGTVSAWVGETEYSTTISAGEYGYSPTFKVPGDDLSTPEKEGAVGGEEVVFKVNGVPAETDPAGPILFESGEVTQVNLSLAGPPPEPLTAEAGGPYSGTEGQSIALSGSASGGTEPYTYAWDLDNDSTYETPGKDVSHSWSTAATYTIGLLVTDNVSETATATTTVSVTAPTQPSGGGGGGGGGAPTYYTETNVFGTEARFRIDKDGEILATIEATSEDGMLTMTIPKGTTALDKDGDRLGSLEAAVDESPPDPPEDTHVIGLAYDFGPDGATFDPPITLAWSYDPEALPEGVAEEDLVIAYYDEAADEWVELDCVVDTVNDTITASVEHFTSFAILGAVTPEVEVEEIAELEKTIGELEAQVASLRGDYDTAQSAVAAAQAKVASAQGDYNAATSDVAAAQTQVTSAQGDYDTAKSSVAAAQAKVTSLQSALADRQERLAEAETRVVELEAAPPNWGVVGGTIAGVVVIVGLLIFFLVYRRRTA